MAKDKSKFYTEAELIKTFQLKCIVETKTERMNIWLQADLPQLDE